MKIVRIFLIVVACILILSQGFFAILFLVEGTLSENYFLPSVLIVIGLLFLYVARLINKKIKKRKICSWSNHCQIDPVPRTEML
jgi:undecaprenyl pyrophosphate phosphatase UppP